MLIGYGRPTSPAWTFVNCNVDGDPADLNNGRPADQTPVQWEASGHVGSFILMQEAWDTPQPVRIIPILGTSLPAGLKIEVTGSVVPGDFTYPLGGNSLTQTIVEFNDGSTGCYIICDDGNDPLIGIQVAIYNDLAGAVQYAADDWLYIGEIDPFRGWQAPVGIRRDWTPGYDGLPEERRGDNQPWLLATLPFRTLEVTLATVRYIAAYGDPGAPTVVDYDLLASALVLGDSCVAIPRWKDATGALDTWALHRTALFGIPRKIGKPVHQNGNTFSMQLAFAEAPAH